jgi:AcrR family transcriptional regulator
MHPLEPPTRRQRKKAQTRERIHKEALRLFEHQGFAATTIAQIADAADVAPRTVFVHYPTKEDLVFGDVESALVAFESALRTRPPDTTALEIVRAWLAHAAGGWLEPDVELQVRLADEVPSVTERKVVIAERFRVAFAEAAASDLGTSPADLRVQLAASGAIAGLLHVEALVTEHVRSKGQLPPPRLLEEVFDRVDSFVRAGISSL